MTDRAATATDDEGPALATLLAVAGESLARSSLPSNYAEEILRSVAAAHGGTAGVQSFPTLVAAQDDRGRSVVRDVAAPYRFDQVAAAGAVVEAARVGGTGPADAVAQLEAVDRLAPPWPLGVRVLGYALQAVGFAMCVRLSWPAIGMAAGLGLVIGLLVLVTTTRWSRGVPLLPVAATFLSALVVGLVSRALDVGDPIRLSAVAVVVLLPGAALVVSMIELSNGEMISGASRFLYALMMLLAMAFGFYLAVTIVAVSPERLQDLTTVRTALWVAWPGAAVYALGNILYLCTPRGWRWWAVVVPVVAFSLSTGAQELVPAPLAAGLAAGVAVLGAYLVVLRRGAITLAVVLWLPAIYLLVPGSVEFVRIADTLTTAQTLGAQGSAVGRTFVGMAVGMMVAGLAVPLLSGRRSARRPGG